MSIHSLVLRYGIAGLIILVSPRSVDATVMLAIKAGASCNLCHVTPSGGGMRNTYGFEEIMLDELPRPKGMSKSHRKFSPQLNQYLRLGMDSRIQAFSYAQHGDQLATSGICPMQLAIHAQLSLGKTYDIYLSRLLLQSSTEFWVRFRSENGRQYFRVGRFLPAFGLRLDDHTSFIRGGNTGRTVLGGLRREGLPFSPYTHGGGEIEGGVYWGDLHLSLSLSNPFISTGGSVDGWFSGMTVVSRAEMYKYVSALDLNTVVGASYLNEYPIVLAGMFGGLSRGIVALLGEVDVGKHWARADVTSLAYYGEISIRAAKGLHFSLKYDHFDEDVSLGEDMLTRFTLASEYFPLPFVELKPQIRYNSNSLGKPSQLQFLLQLHMFI